VLQITRMDGQSEDRSSAMYPHPESSPIDGHEASPGASAAENQGRGCDRAFVLGQFDLAEKSTVVEASFPEGLASIGAQEPCRGGESVDRNAHAAKNLEAVVQLAESLGPGQLIEFTFAVGVESSHHSSDRTSANLVGHVGVSV